MTNQFVENVASNRIFIDSLQRLSEKLEKTDLALFQGSYLQKNSYQLIAQLLTPSNPLERMLFQELLQTCFQLELKCQRSSCLFLKAFLVFSSEYSKHPELTHRALVEDNHREAARYWDELSKACYPATADEVTKLILQACNNDPVVATIVAEATKLAGIEGNIVLEEWSQPNTLIELQFGYNFKVSPYKGFLPTLSNWSRADLKILLVDGLVEKVSELDKLLRKSFETKLPLMIVAQGFSEEVVATLYSNNSRGNFDVMPIKLEQSLETLNLLNDIAVVVGCDVVNTLKGDMLLYADYDTLGTVEKATLAEKVLTIHNNKTRGNVLEHLKYLEAKRKDQTTNTTISDLSDLTTKRMQNLLAHLVKVSIPKAEAKRVTGAIDNGLRACRTAYTYGFCKPSEINLCGLSSVWKAAHTAAVKDIGSFPSGVGLFIAMKYAACLAASYFTAAGAVVIDSQVLD